MENYFITFKDITKDDNEYLIASSKQEGGAEVIDKLIASGYKWLDMPFVSYRETDILIFNPSGKTIVIYDRYTKHCIEDNNCKYIREWGEENYIQIHSVREVLFFAQIDKEK